MDIDLDQKLKVLSLNIEGDNHLDRVIRIIKIEKPDVACLQEVFKADIHYLQGALGMCVNYTPLMSIKYANTNNLAPKGLWGLLMLTRNDPLRSYAKYYVGKADDIPIFDGSPNSNNRAVLVADLKKMVSTLPWPQPISPGLQVAKQPHGNTLIWSR